MGIREEMPVLARHEGEWDGTYIVVDTNGTVLDRHRAQITCAFPTEGPYAYQQTNRYTWPDGRTETIDFPATYRDGNIWFDTDRLVGHAWEVDERTVILTWSYRSDPQTYLYEMIQLDDTAVQRSRVWQWFERGRVTRRTLIEEHRVS